MTRNKDHHAKGQHDRGKGRYEPPHGIVKDLFTWSSDGTRRITRENGQYSAGWRNADKTKR